MPESRTITPEVGFRAQARRKGIVCGIGVRLTGGSGVPPWSGQPPWSWKSEVDLADPDAIEALLRDLGEADEQRRLASGLAGLPPLDLDGVRSAVDGRRQLELSAVLSVEVHNPACRQNQVWGEVVFRSRRVRHPDPIYHTRQIQISDDVAIESLIVPAQTAWQKYAPPDLSRLIDWPALIADLDRQRQTLSERYAQAGRLHRADGDGRVLDTVVAAIVRREIDWLWPGWLPRGKLSLVAGDPGAGKGWFSLAVATAVTRGVSLPGMHGPVERGNVCLIAPEDDPADTIRPRLEDMGADMERVYLLDGVAADEGERPLMLPRDAGPLREWVLRREARLIIVDPVITVQDPRLDSSSQTAVRLLMAPLVALARDTGAAVLLTHHTNKAQVTQALYKVNSSIDFTAAPRVVIAAAKNHENPERYDLAVMKCNIGAWPPGRDFTVTNGRFAWGDRAHPGLTAAQLFTPPAEAGRGMPSAADKAREWLEEQLAGGPMPAAEIQKRARHAGISQWFLTGARKALGLEVWRENETGEHGAGRWMWAPPGQGTGSKSEGVPGDPPRSSREHILDEDDANAADARVSGDVVRKGEPILDSSAETRTASESEDHEPRMHSRERMGGATGGEFAQTHAATEENATAIGCSVGSPINGSTDVDVALNPRAGRVARAALRAHEEILPDPPGGPCPDCGGEVWALGPDWSWSCATCLPQPDDRVVAAATVLPPEGL